MVGDLFDGIFKKPEGEFLLTPSLSKEYNLHIKDILNYLQGREEELGFPLWIDVNIHPKGAMFAWFEKNVNIILEDNVGNS